MTEKEDNNNVFINDIILRFPESVSSEAFEKEFKFSINDARQSDFIATLLDDCSNKEKGIYTIPDTLYKGLDILIYIILLIYGREKNI